MSSNVGKLALVATAAVAAPFALPALGAAAGGGAALSSGAIGLASGGALLPSAAIAGGGVGIGTILSGAGLAMNLFGQHQSSKAAEANAKYNAQLSDLNARTQAQNAALARSSAADAAERTRKDTRRRVSAIRSAFTKGGVLTTEGSPLLVQQEQFAEGLAESGRQLYQGELQAQASLQQSGVESMRAAATRSKAKSDRPVSYTHLTLPTNREV